MKRIEIIGGSGVGKTTLLKEIVKLKKAQDCWMTVEEVKLHLAKTVKPKRKLHRLFQLFLKISSINILQSPMMRRILNSYAADVLASMQGYYSDVADLILEVLYKNDNINPLKKMVSAYNYYTILFHGIMLFDYFKVDSLVVFDEGIIKNSSVFSDEERVKFLFDNHRKLETSLMPVGIVYCYLDRIKYLERRKNRIREGKAPFFDINLKFKELEGSCFGTLKVTEDKIKMLKNYNIKILELNMEAPVSVNAKKAYDFINILSIRS